MSEVHARRLLVSYSMKGGMELHGGVVFFALLGGSRRSAGSASSSPRSCSRSSWPP